MRAFCFVAFVAAASAVSLSHAPAAHGISVGVNNDFAKSVLAEVNAHLSQGSPIDQLMRILNDIRARIRSANASDAAGWAGRADECATEISNLNKQIEDKETELTTNNEDQVNTQARIDEEIANIAQATEDLRFNTQMWEEQKAAIITLNNERDNQAAIFENQTSDVAECIQAVEAIISLSASDNDLLTAKQGETAENVVQPYQYEKLSEEKNSEALSTQNGGGGKFTALLALQSKMHSKAARAMLQQAVGGNVNDFTEMLDNLKSELVTYNADLVTKEDEAKAQHKIDLQALETARDGWKVQMEDSAEKKKTAELQLQSERGHLAVLKNEETEMKKQLASLKSQKKTWEGVCANQERDFNDRVAERNEELQTVALIEQKISEKLGHQADAGSRSATENKVYNAIKGVN